MTRGSEQHSEFSPLLFRLFSRYNDWYLRRHFHALRLYGRDDPPALPDDPPIFYLNHPGWWDPLISLRLINQYWPGYTHFTPMEEEQLNTYGFFRKIGAFGVKTGTMSAGRRFLRTCEHLLSRERTALWITPQGRFADARARPLDFRPGLGHLASRLSSGTLVPVALTYSFWTDRYPEVLIGFGRPFRIRDHRSRSSGGWTDLLENRLTSVLDDVLRADRERNPDAFRVIMGGSSGVGGIYGAWKWVRERVFGQTGMDSGSQETT